MNNEEKLTKLFLDESFKKEANTCETVEEFQSLFERYGVEMSLEEVAELCGKIAEQVNSEDDELKEENLEDVTGGFAVTAGLIALGVVCIGAAALGAWNKYQSLKHGK